MATGRFLAKTTMARKAADAAIGGTKQALIEMGRKHVVLLRWMDVPVSRRGSP